MTHSRMYLVFIVPLLACSLLGCAGSSTPDASLGNPAAATAVLAAPGANVSFAVRVDEAADTADQTPTVASVRAAKAGEVPQVTFTLVTLNIGNVEQPISSQSVTVAAVNGSASASFANVPAVPTLARVSVSSGTIAGFSDYHGAADLIVGNNTIVVNPKNSRLKQDVIAQVIENIIANRQVFRFAGLDLTTRLRQIITNLDRQAATVYQTAFTQIAQQLDTANVNGSPVAMPGVKSVAESLSSPTTLIRLSLREALQLARNNIHLSVRDHAKTDAPAVPAIVPILGDNTALSAGGILRRVMAAIPTTGMLASDGPIIDDFQALASRTTLATMTPTAIEISDYASTATRLVKSVRTYLKDVTVQSSSDGVVTSIALNSASTITQDKYDTSGSIIEHWVFKPTTSFTITVTYSLVPTTSTLFYRSYTVYTYFGSSSEATDYGMLATMIGTQTTTLTIPNEGLGVGFEYQEGTKPIATGSILLHGLTGSVQQQTGVATGLWASRRGTNAPQIITNFEGITQAKKRFLDSFETNNLTTVGTTVRLTANGAAPGQGFVLDNLIVNMPNFTRTTGTDPFNYKFTGGTAEVSLRYVGNSPADYGYIYRLAIFASGINFDAAQTEPVADGADLSVTRVSTDNSVSGFHYRLVNHQPQLQQNSSLPFLGGTESVGFVVATGTTNELAKHVTGQMRLVDPAQIVATVAYDVTSTTNGNADGRCTVKVAGAERTMYFTLRDDLITGRAYGDAHATDDNINPVASFTIPLNRRWIYVVPPGSMWGYTTIQQPTIDYLPAFGNVHSETFTFDL